MRIVPGNGMVLVNADDQNLADVMDRGCWSERQYFSIEAQADWVARPRSEDFSEFEIQAGDGTPVATRSPMIGSFNMCNALAAVAAACHAGVDLERACEGVATFRSIKRRLQLLATVKGIHIYDDFAHHPTAISQTLEALRVRAGHQRIVCVLEPRSNTMLLGKHQTALKESFVAADRVLLYKPEKARWNMDDLASESVTVSTSVPEMVRMLVAMAKSGDHVVIMSNGSFGNIYNKLIEALNVTQ